MLKPTTFVAAAAALASCATAQSSPSAYQSSVLTQHNLHRANHSAPDMTWNQDIANYAYTLASSCQWGHNTDIGGGGYGQNLAAGEQNVAAAITDLWYNGEEPQYTYYGSEPNMADFENWGHFTQVVWVGSTGVGCATYDCGPNGLINNATGQPMDGLEWYTVCNYSPPGNYVGNFTPNVLAPLGQPPVII